MTLTEILIRTTPDCIVWVFAFTNFVNSNIARILTNFKTGNEFYSFLLLNLLKASECQCREHRKSRWDEKDSWLATKQFPNYQYSVLNFEFYLTVSCESKKDQSPLSISGSLVWPVTGPVPTLDKLCLLLHCPLSTFEWGTAHSHIHVYHQLNTYCCWCGFLLNSLTINIKRIKNCIVCNHL